MSKMADLAYDIEQLWIEGLSPAAIANVLRCPLELVNDWIQEQKLAAQDEAAEYWGA